MKILVVDDEPIALESSVLNIKKAFIDAEIYQFTNPKKAKESLNENKYDLAVSDIEMPEINGVSLAKAIKIVNPECDIMFFTAYSEFAVEAFKIHAKGYVLKGSSSDEIKEAFDYFKSDNSEEIIENKLEVKCFGKFDCYKNGEIVTFERKKAKELFAYLIYNNGKSCSIKDISLALFDDDENEKSNLKQVHVFFSSLNKTLIGLGIKNCIIKSWNNYSIDLNLINSDYAEYMNGTLKGINKYKDKPFKEYKWSK